MPLENQPGNLELTAEELLAEQREANEKLLLAAISADEVAELRERLIGIIGHDLRTPLSTILTSAHLLLAHGKLGDVDVRLANRIVASGQRMARRIDDVLAFTRTRLGGGLVLTLGPVDMGAVCQDMADELRATTTSHIEVLVVGDVRGTWDGGRIEAMISNLAKNATDYATPRSTVRIDALADDDEVFVSITNEGPTIPEEQLGTLFDPFRSGRAARDDGHMGLGLYIADQIARAHGGTLTVRSEGGHTAFTARLPRHAVQGV